ncbi:hypothetical protein PF004_g16803 [Phytophthora fragariae]|uniref:CCHC-type domain-containing protein n=2 Tax=Phytophthora fragariae TaxID=53985 RepID=A0A6A3KAB7_9STRA|nr:hypothetical protein PF011_g13921 [Phytophthora fragariae]KAE9208292.1 hypothetical protein PF004_g16803 [Phytophthora fragariae]
MSPIRAQRSTDVASGVDDTTGQDEDEVLTNPDNATQRLAESVQRSRTFSNGDSATDQTDSALSHDETERLVRSLAGTRGGRTLIRVLLEGLSHLAHSVSAPSIGNPPPQPPSDPGSEGSSHGGRDPDEQSQGSAALLDNTFPGGRYDNRELAEYTKVLRNSAPIQLPQLYSKSDYKAWKSEVPLHFEPRGLGDITYGGKRYDVDKAFSALALSLSVDLSATFRIDELRDNMEAASVLWSFITKHFEAGDGINPDYLMRDLMMRMMQTNEKVDAYADDIEKKATKLRQAKGEFEEWQQASLLLSNSVLVFPDVTREYANWLNSNDRKTLKLATVLQRLRAAEHQRQQLESQSQPATRAVAPVAQVSASQGSTRKRSKGAYDKKARSNCGNCGAEGHWWLECTETTGKPLKPELEKRKKDKLQGRQPPTSLVNSVRVVQLDEHAAAPRQLFDAISLTSPPSAAETMRDGSATTAQATSPVYSPTSPTSDEEETKSQGPQQTPPVAPTLATAEKQVQQALQTLVATAAKSQWEGAAPRGPPPTWEQVLYHMGQGLKEGMVTKVTVLAHLDAKNGMECNEVMIIKDANLNEAARTHVTTAMVGHHEDAEDRRQEGAAGLLCEDATMGLRVDHQDGAEARHRLKALDAGGTRRHVDRP